MAMTKRTRLRALIALSVAALLLGAGWLTLLLAAPEPPVQAFETAQRALAQARAAEAARYAPDAYRTAEREWEAAVAAWRLENGRFFALRAYDELATRAQHVAETARAARSRAQTRRDSLRWVATAGADAVRDRFLVVYETARRMPYDARWHADLSVARTLLGEAEGAARRGDYLAAARKVELAAGRLGAAHTDVSTALDVYLADLEAWRAWEQEAVAQSARDGSTVLVVDKMARRLHAYVGGERRHTFPVELGPNWMGPKRQEGDRATPEGRYRVLRKRGPGATSYTLALELDYPNADDRRRFEAERAAGTIAPDARIGGLIEIHGAGGRGADWTEGCVALTDADIAVLYDLARVGTPVVIVGALERPSFAPPPRRPDPLSPATLPVSTPTDDVPLTDSSAR